MASLVCVYRSHPNLFGNMIEYPRWFCTEMVIKTINNDSNIFCTYIDFQHTLVYEHMNLILNTSAPNYIASMVCKIKIKVKLNPCADIPIQVER